MLIDISDSDSEDFQIAVIEWKGQWSWIETSNSMWMQVKESCDDLIDELEVEIDT